MEKGTQIDALVPRWFLINIPTPMAFLPFLPCPIGHIRTIRLVNTMTLELLVSYLTIEHNIKCHTLFPVI